jgi:hypothetical protein
MLFYELAQRQADHTGRIRCSAMIDQKYDYLSEQLTLWDQKGIGSDSRKAGGYTD